MRYEGHDNSPVCFNPGQKSVTLGFDMKHTGSRALHSYWEGLRAGRSAPYKAEVTASGLGRGLAPYVFMLESLGSGAFRFRVSGSALYDIFGLELRGMGAEAVMAGESRQRFVSLAEKTLSSGTAAVARGTTSGGAALDFELLLLPLRSDFGQMDRVLGAFHVFNEAALQQQGEISRRCRIRETALIGVETKVIRGAAPLPGFAEPAGAFRHDRAALKSVTGGATQPKERRRDHLRVVKD